MTTLWRGGEGFSMGCYAGHSREGTGLGGPPSPNVGDKQAGSLALGPPPCPVTAPEAVW